LAALQAEQLGALVKQQEAAAAAERAALTAAAAASQLLARLRSADEEAADRLADLLKCIEEAAAALKVRGRRWCCAWSSAW
jgi:hypothetical protein